MGGADHTRGAPSRPLVGIRAQQDGFRARPVQVITEIRAASLDPRRICPGDQVVVRGVLPLLASLAEPTRTNRCSAASSTSRSGSACWCFSARSASPPGARTAYLNIPIDAFPDVAPIQVLVSMRAPGLTPEELETRVTAPIEIAMRGIPNLVGMRSQTRYAVSLMVFEFADGTDIFWARAQVNERLQEMRDQLPPGADGGLAPIVTPLGEMFMFTIDSETMSAQEMRSFVDWVDPARRCAAFPASPTSTCWAATCAPSR